MITLLKARILLNSISIKLSDSMICREIDTCDALLAQMQELLHTYQHDLSGVANEIRSLQVNALVLQIITRVIVLSFHRN